MLVKVRFTGIVRHYIGVKEREFELPQGSNAGDLLCLIGKEYASRLPENMWDVCGERFHPLIKAGRKGEPFADEDEVLSDRDEIFIISRMAGG
jgi:molybdopterin converting factor small subunit